MDLKGIYSIPGKPGLYKFISQAKSATIVESLKDKNKFPIYMSDRATDLEGISIFTSGDEAPLREIMDIIYDKESGGPCIDPKSDDKAIWAYFMEILPTCDRAKVYTSDVRKVFLWYNTLHSMGMLKKEETKEEVKEETKPAEETTGEETK